MPKKKTKKRDRKIGIFYMSIPRKNEALNWSEKGSPVVYESHYLPIAFVFVRCQVVRAKSLMDALDKAKPRSGETVMNTHYVER